MEVSACGRARSVRRVALATNAFAGSCRRRWCGTQRGCRHRARPRVAATTSFATEARVDLTAEGVARRQTRNARASKSIALTRRDGQRRGPPALPSRRCEADRWHGARHRAGRRPAARITHGPRATFPTALRITVAIPAYRRCGCRGERRRRRRYVVRVRCSSSVSVVRVSCSVARVRCSVFRRERRRRRRRCCRHDRERTAQQ